jgi:16S rRNA (cytidine1402-2'-O)-methyltransferase
VGTLYLVATPIGNLEDVTLRALRVLGEVGLIAAEDTRQTRKLLAHHGITTPLVSCHAHNERARAAQLAAQLAERDVALVSDAGTPTISDPGGALVEAALAAGHRVVPIPGPSAVLAALAASGLPTARFLFVGFPPRHAAERRAALAELRAEPSTLVLFEAPHRLRGTLADALAVLGDRSAAAARELTKLHEELVRGTLGSLVQHFAHEAPRGEFTLVVGGAIGDAARPDEPVAGVDALAALDAALARGLKPRAAAAEVSRQTGIPSRSLYRLIRSDSTCRSST